MIDYQRAYRVISQILNTKVIQAIAIWDNQNEPMTVYMTVLGNYMWENQKRMAKNRKKMMRNDRMLLYLWNDGSLWTDYSTERMWEWDIQVQTVLSAFSGMPRPNQRSLKQQSS